MYEKCYMNKIWFDLIWFNQQVPEDIINLCQLYIGLSEIQIAKKKS